MAGAIPMTDLSLAHGLAFADLYRPEGLARLDSLFLAALGEADPALRDRLVAARDRSEVAGKPESELLIALGPHLEDFIGGLFGIRAEIGALAARHNALAPLFACKRLFVQRRAMRAHKPEAAAAFDPEALAEGWRGPSTSPSPSSPSPATSWPGWRTRPPAARRSTSRPATPPGRC